MITFLTKQKGEKSAHIHTFLSLYLLMVIECIYHLVFMSARGVRMWKSDFHHMEYGIILYRISISFIIIFQWISMRENKIKSIKIHFESVEANELASERKHTHTHTWKVYRGLNVDSNLFSRFLFSRKLHMELMLMPLPPLSWMPFDIIYMRMCDVWYIYMENRY